MLNRGREVTLYLVHKCMKKKREKKLTNGFEQFTTFSNLFLLLLLKMHNSSRRHNQVQNKLSNQTVALGTLIT